MGALAPLMLLGGGRGFGRFSMRKALKWMMFKTMGLGPLAVFMGGFGLMDLLIMPMIEPFLAPLMGSITGMFGGGGAAPAAATGPIG